MQPLGVLQSRASAVHAWTVQIFKIPIKTNKRAVNCYIECYIFNFFQVLYLKFKMNLYIKIIYKRSVRYKSSFMNKKNNIKSFQFVGKIFENEFFKFKIKFLYQNHFPKIEDLLI